MKILCSALALTFAISAQSMAGLIPNAGISFESAFWSDGTKGVVVGYDFTPDADITITDLGFYDVGHDGLPAEETYPVGIYVTSTQTLVPGATAVVTNADGPGIGDETNGYF